MKYLSTRGGEAVAAAQAIVRGICPSGGLYVPASFPELDVESLPADYLEAAFEVMSRYLTETDPENLRGMIKSAYRSFDDERVTPVHALTERESILELWHGPTMAFKDVALQMLPYLMRDSLLLTGKTGRSISLLQHPEIRAKRRLPAFATCRERAYWCSTRMAAFRARSGCKW